MPEPPGHNPPPTAARKTTATTTATGTLGSVGQFVSFRGLIVLVLVIWLTYYQFQCQTLRPMVIDVTTSGSATIRRPSLNTNINITSASSAASSSLNKSYYRPAMIEDHVIDHSQELGYESAQNPPGCSIWQNSVNANPESQYESLVWYDQELKNYADWVNTFRPVVDDLRDLIRRQQQSSSSEDYTSAKEQVCARLLPFPDNTGVDNAVDGGVSQFFAKSRQISYTGSAGYVEPLLPPMRHHNICFPDRGPWGKSLMSTEYMVHDFHHLCRQLQPTSRTIFLDMGASLEFHAGMDSPAMYVNKIFRKFGFAMDHIYAFEITPQDPKSVYKQVPMEWMRSYHWINVAVSPEVGHPQNPLSSIIDTYNVDDLIIVKLDVDTPSVELPIAYQILANYSHLVDVLFFEHHVHLGELAGNWGGSMNGTIADTLRLFRALREKASRRIFGRD